MASGTADEDGGWYSAVMSPASVAVIGASSHAEKNHYLDQLLAYGYPRPLYPINTRADEIQGLRVYRRIGDVPVRVDLALIAVPAHLVPQAVEECVAAGVRALYVMAAGFGESGSDGAALEDRITAALASAGGRTRLLGPNGTGILSVDASLVALPLGARHITLPTFCSDGVAVVSQSGLVASAAFIAAQSSGLGVAKTVAVGNEVDVTLPEVIEAMADDPTVRVIVGYIEGLRDGPGFVQAMRRLQRAGKHLVVLKGGVTTEGAAAAASHTASLAGEGRVFAGILSQFGGHAAKSTTHMIDVARILSAYPDLRGNNATVLTDSGGYGIMMTDFLVISGLGLATWGGQAQALLAADLPARLSIANPMDGSGEFAWARQLLETAFEAGEANEDTDFILVCFGGLPDSEAAVSAEIIRLARMITKPVFVAWAGGLGKAIDALNAAKIPAFADIRNLAEALETVLGRREGCGESSGETAPGPALVEEVATFLAGQRGVRSLDEVASKGLLRTAGVNVVSELTAGDAETAVHAARQLGLPVVIKLRASGLAHKSELGAIALDVRDESSVRRETDRLLAIASANALVSADVVLQNYVEPGLEFLVGMHRDPAFGPVVTFGLGGVLAEALNDVVSFLPDVDFEQFRDAMASLRHQELLGGFRHLPRADPAVLWAAVSRFCTLVRALPQEIEEIDVNPLVLHPDGSSVIAVDALVVRSAHHPGPAEAPPLR